MSKSIAKKNMLAFVKELAGEDILLRINNESVPEAPRKNRMDSKTLWKALNKHFGFSSEPSDKHAQGCRNDLSCLRLRVIEDIDILDEEMLQGIQRIVTSASLPPFNSLKDWFSPVNKAAGGKFGNDHTKTKLIAKFMKSPEAQQMIQRKGANDGVISRNKKQLKVHYPQTLRIIQRMITSPKWQEQFCGVQAAIGARQVAILDPKIKFVEAEQAGHDKKFWVLQEGVLKDKSQKFEENDDGNVVLVAGKVVEKPIAFGLSFAQISAAIEFIRANTDVDGLSRRAMGAKYNKELTAIVKREFPGPAVQNERLGTHFLRALYANVAHHFFSSEIGDSLTAFISDVLAHNSNSLNTALSYQTISVQWGLPDNISADTKAIAMQNREAIAGLLDMVKQLRANMGQQQEEEEKEQEEENGVGISDNMSETDKTHGSWLIGRRVVSIPKAKRQKRKRTDAEEDKVMTDAEAELKKHKIEPTRPNLKKLGLGSTLISRVRKRREAQ